MILIIGMQQGIVNEPRYQGTVCERKLAYRQIHRVIPVTLSPQHPQHPPTANVSQQPIMPETCHFHKGNLPQGVIMLFEATTQTLILLFF